MLIGYYFFSLYPGIGAAPGVAPGGVPGSAAAAHHLNQFVQPHHYSAQQQQQLQQQAQMQRLAFYHVNRFQQKLFQIKPIFWKVQKWHLKIFRSILTKDMSFPGSGRKAKSLMHAFRTL